MPLSLSHINQSKANQKEKEACKIFGKKKIALKASQRSTSYLRQHSSGQVVWSYAMCIIMAQRKPPLRYWRTICPSFGLNAAQGVESRSISGRMHFRKAFSVAAKPKQAGISWYSSSWKGKSDGEQGLKEGGGSTKENIPQY